MCAGRPEPSRPATYFTSGAYVRISRSRSVLSLVRRYSSQRFSVSVSPATAREYELAADSPQCGPREGAHPRRERGRGDGDHPAPGGASRNCDPGERDGQNAEQHGRPDLAHRDGSCRTHRYNPRSEPRGVAQLAEHRSPKPGVEGSSPFAPVSLVERNPTISSAFPARRAYLSLPLAGGRKPPPQCPALSRRLSRTGCPPPPEWVAVDAVLPNLPREVTTL